MKTIYKYRLSDCLMLPEGARILCAKIIDSHYYLWAEVDPLKGACS
jgi:hypothetical protein